MARTAKAEGEAFDAGVSTEAVITPDTVLTADLAGEHNVRLDKTRDKVEKLKAQLADAQAEVARLEKESK